MTYERRDGVRKNAYNLFSVSEKHGEATEEEVLTVVVDHRRV